MTRDDSLSPDFELVSESTLLWVNFKKFKCNKTGRTRTEIASKRLTYEVILFQIALSIVIFFLNWCYKKAAFDFSISKDGIPKAQEGVSEKTIDIFASISDFGSHAPYYTILITLVFCRRSKFLYYSTFMAAYFCGI